MRNYILQIDTATEICSVSISSEGISLASIEASEPNLHASKLTVFIDQLLREVRVDYSELSAVCVSKGPGSYTGLRIGVSTAKGLCYALDIPLLAINTLDMMFSGYTKDENQDTLYVPMLDARRMEVYLEIFDSKNNRILPTEAKVIDEDSFSEFEAKKIVLFGSGAAKLSALFSSNDAIFIETDFLHSSAYMSAFAFAKFNNQEFEDLIYFEPYYLKEFIATMPKKVL